MKAICSDTFGSPDVLELREIEQPDLTDDGVLVRVRASSVNPADWYGMTGRPYVGRVGDGALQAEGAVARRRLRRDRRGRRQRRHRVSTG